MTWWVVIALNAVMWAGVLVLDQRRWRKRRALGEPLRWSEKPRAWLFVLCAGLVVTAGSVLDLRDPDFPRSMRVEQMAFPVSMVVVAGVFYLLARRRMRTFEHDERL